MTEAELIASLIGSLMLSFFVGYQWGKYAKILKDLGR